MFNDSTSNEANFEQTNCAFYNSTTHTCRYCQETGLDCPGEHSCELFYNKDITENLDPNTMSIISLAQNFEIQQKQRLWLAEALEKLQENYTILLAEKNSKEEKLMQAKAENTRLHEENRRVSLRFANTANETKPNINIEKLKELGALQQQIRTMTELQQKLESSLAQAQAENTALKIDNGVLAQARTYLEQNLNGAANQQQMANAFKELSDKLLQGNKDLTDKLLASNQEFGSKLLDNNQELGNKLLNDNKALGEKLANDSADQTKLGSVIIDHIKQLRNKMDNLDNSIANIDDNNTTIKIMVAMIIGGLLGVLAGLGCYRIFFM